MVRARFRDGMEHPLPIEPRRPYADDINCWNTCQVSKKGHRIRLLLLRCFGFGPEGAAEQSPGQRPGYADVDEKAPSPDRATHPPARPLVLAGIRRPFRPT
jgi:hypothetical protein